MTNKERDSMRELIDEARDVAARQRSLLDKLEAALDRAEAIEHPTAVEEIASEHEEQEA